MITVNITMAGWAERALQQEWLPGTFHIEDIPIHRGPGNMNALSSRLGICAVVVAAFAGQSFGAVELTTISGTFIGTNGGPVGDRIVLIDGTTRTPRTLIQKDSLNKYSGGMQADWVSQTRYSPDGSQFCFVHYWWTANYAGHGLAIFTADNDGRSISKICELNYAKSNADYIALSWCTDGYIYWSECTDTVWRVSPVAKQREAYWANVGVTGYHGEQGPYVENLTVARDGRIGASNNGGHIHALNLATRDTIITCGGGCRGSITTSGDALVHWLTCCGYYPPGYDGSNAFMSVTVLHSLTNCDNYTYMYAPGCATAPVNGNRVWMYRGACNSNDWLVGIGDQNLGGKGVLSNRNNSDWMILDGYIAHDFWLGTLPPPPVATPRIALDSTQITFTSLGGVTPANKTVHVSNSGVGALTNVTVTESAAWLTVTRSGSGNAQTLTNAADPAGLARGAYSTTVTVNGGGAGNAQSYTVTLNIGSAVAAPTGLTASPGAAAGTVVLAWLDNATNENGYLVERKGTGSWSQVKSLAANSTALIDSSLAPATYSYRVRAYAGTDTSGYSNEATATVSAVITITVTSPTAGQTLTAGSTVTIRWSAPNSGGVAIEWSADDGDRWGAVTTSGSVRPADANWGAYQWMVPDTLSTTCLVRVMEYTAHGTYGVSPGFTITRSSGVAALGRPLARAAAQPARLVDLRGRIIPVGVGRTGSDRVSLVKNCGLFGVVLGR
jgi:hypothetical protein